jgi:hypothetical protein
MTKIQLHPKVEAYRLLFFPGVLLSLLRLLGESASDPCELKEEGNHANYRARDKEPWSGTQPSVEKVTTHDVHQHGNGKLRTKPEVG